jgi:uncharacterized membrane protein YjfL (UPF0719 family)
MNAQVVVVGLLQTVFGLAVALGIALLAVRTLGRALRWPDIIVAIRSGEIAAGIVFGAALVACGLLVQPAVVATFDAMDLLYRSASPEFGMLVAFVLYALAHLAAAVSIAVIVIASCCRLFDRATSGLDETAEARKGNVSAALMLAGVFVLVALMAAPGLKLVLAGLLPFPDLPRDVLPAPT